MPQVVGAVLRGDPGAQQVHGRRVALHRGRRLSLFHQGLAHDPPRLRNTRVGLKVLTPPWVAPLKGGNALAEMCDGSRGISRAAVHEPDGPLQIA